MAEASADERDATEEEILTPATDRPASEFIWMGSLFAAFAYDENEDSWILVAGRSPRWVPQLCFETPAVDVITGEPIFV